MRIIQVTAAIALLLSLAVPTCSAKDNELTPEEKAAGWKLLFTGKDYSHWKPNTGGEVKSPIEEDCLMPHKSGGYLVIHEDQFGDFILRCDVKMSSGCNSGIFFRVGDPKNAVQTGFEIQIATGKGANSHSFGAVYDTAAAKNNNARPAGEWNAVEITAKGPRITVAVNGEVVTTMNCDDYTEVGKNPDGSKNKFRKAVKDFPRKGYIGFQDHGTKCWYKNIRILEIPDGAKSDKSG